MAKGECELCGFADDSYRIDENGTVMHVCKFCHDGYMARMGLSPDADKPVEDVALTLDLSAIKDAGIDTEGLSGAELLQLKMDIEAQNNRRVQTLDAEQLNTLLNGTEDDKKILDVVRQKELRRKRKASQAGLDDSGEDYKASEELLRSGEELQQAVLGLDDVTEEDIKAAPLIAKILAPQEKISAETTATKAPPAEREAAAEEKEEETVQTETPPKESAEKPTEAVAPPAEQTEKTAEAETAIADETQEEQTPEERQAEQEERKIAAMRREEESAMSSKSKALEPVPENSKGVLDTEKLGKEVTQKVSKEVLVREKILAAANQTIDDDRIQITSPEVALARDVRPKTNLDVAISEYAGGVRFLDSFRYVMHRVSYAILLGLIVLAVSTVLFIRDTWQHAVIVLSGGVGAVFIGFLLVWYLSHCYETDKRALLLRIRQQEILFESMNSDCYRELRTKFTIIKALGWLLNKLTVLLPLVVLVGGNVAAVVLCFLQNYWLLPVVSGATSVAGVLIYYLVKFAADWIAYALDRERNQQIQQQTLLDILDQLKKQ